MICKTHGQLEQGGFYQYGPRTFCKQCHKIRTKSYRGKNRKRLTKMVLDWRKVNRKKNRLTQSRSLSRHPETMERRRVYERNKARERRIIVLKHYGGETPKCACPGCNQTVIQFLTIDHIHGNGKEHRKIHGSGTPMYRWIVKNQFPPIFQVLCWNCNSLNLQRETGL